MRGLLLCLAALISLAPLTLAQTEAIQPTAEISAETIGSPNAETSLPARIAPTDWQIRVPDSLSPHQDFQPQPGPLLMLHPKPITLNALTQHTPPHRFGFEFSIGGYQPSGELRNTNLIHTTVGIGFGLAIRPSANWSRLQFDAGTDLVIDGIGSPREEEIAPGTFRGIDDVEAFVYLGPRIYLTPRDSPLKFSLGGGGTFAYYKETIQSYDDDNDGDENDTPCFSCESRKGWGAYAMAQLRYQIAPEFGIGVTAKYYRVKTEGDSFSGNLPNRTRDNWLGIMLTVSFR